jgi:hypothetical protein
MSHNLKIVEPTINGPREALARAIDECRDADAAAVKAREAVTAASTMLDEAERDLEAARTTVEEARDAHRDRLVASVSSGLAPAADVGLRTARLAEVEAEDTVVAFKSALEQLHSAATSATAAANRANDRRQKAINELARPECAQLMGRVQGLTHQLGEARLALRFVGKPARAAAARDAAIRRYCQPGARERGLQILARGIADGENDRKILALRAEFQQLMATREPVQTRYKPLHIAR